MIIDGFVIDMSKGFTIKDKYNRTLKVYKQSYQLAKMYMQKHPGTFLVYYGTKIEPERRIKLERNK